MNLYLISQTANRTWDTYDSAVVASHTEAEAERIDPSWDSVPVHTIPTSKDDLNFNNWVQDPNLVTVKLIGTTDIYTEPCVICDSFNAG